MSDKWAGIDVGGTKVLCVVVDGASGTVLASHKVKTGNVKTVEAVLGKVREAFAGAVSAAGGCSVEGVGLAVPGPVDSEKRFVHKAVNLGWHQLVDLSRFAQDELKVPFLWLDNDANMGAYGEATQGAGKGSNSCYAIFAGSGLGAGYLLNGELVTGTGGNCGEIGHTCMDLRGKKAQLCGCGLRGCLETFASKSGILSFLRAKAPVAGSATATLDKLAPEWRTQMIGSKVLKKACKSDVLVDKALKRAADALGAGVANVITTTGCDTVVVGGGLIEEIGTLWPRVLASVAQHSLAGEANKDLVKKTILGDSANAVGAAAYARKMARK